MEPNPRSNFRCFAKKKFLHFIAFVIFARQIVLCLLLIVCYDIGPTLE